MRGSRWRGQAGALAPGPPLSTGRWALTICVVMDGRAYFSTYRLLKDVFTPFGRIAAL